jgi:tripartite-type tricarboxylate transporter receptor subunit TctC
MKSVAAMLSGALLLCLSVFTAPPARATGPAYPTKPVRLIIPYVAGGSGDVVARLLAVKLTEAWGQQLVIDNRPGSNGMLGTEIVARAAPDGYTILLATDIRFAISPALYGKITYDPERDFSPISLAAFIEFVLAVPRSLGPTSLAEFIGLAKSKPGRLNYGSAGNGSTHHLAMELLKSRAGINLIHVPYKGSAQALPDLIAGQIDAMYLGIAQTLPFIQSHDLVPLAVGSSERLKALPTTQTLADTYPGLEANAWWGFFAPAGTAPSITDKLSTDINAAVRSPMIADRLLEQGLRPVGTTPQELGRRVTADREKWGRVIADAQIKLD